MKAVVDTSILIDYLRGGLRWEKFLEKEEKDAELFLPTIVIFELFAGKSTADSRKTKDILIFLEKFHLIELDMDIAQRAGELYRDVNKTLQVPDYIIAASCLSIGGVLVTLNTKHFQQIQGLALYQL